MSTRSDSIPGLLPFAREHRPSLAQDLIATNALWRLSALSPLIEAALGAPSIAKAVPTRVQNFVRMTLGAVRRLADIKREDYTARLLTGEQIAGDLAPFCRVCARLLDTEHRKTAIRGRDMTFAGDYLDVVSATTRQALALDRSTLLWVSPVIAKIRTRDAHPLAAEAKRVVLHDVLAGFDGRLDMRTRSRIVGSLRLSQNAPSPAQAMALLNDGLDAVIDSSVVPARTTERANLTYVRNWGAPDPERDPLQRMNAKRRGADREQK